MPQPFATGIYAPLSPQDRAKLNAYYRMMGSQAPVSVQTSVAMGNSGKMDQVPPAPVPFIGMNTPGGASHPMMGNAIPPGADTPAPSPMPPGVPYGPGGDPTVAMDPRTQAGPSPMPPGVPFGPGGGVTPSKAKAKGKGKGRTKGAFVPPIPATRPGMADAFSGQSEPDLEVVRGFGMMGAGFSSDTPDESPSQPSDNSKDTTSKDTASSGDKPGWQQLLTSPGFGSLLQNIGLGIMSNRRDPFAGAAAGIQQFKQEQAAQEQQAQEQANTERSFKDQESAQAAAEARDKRDFDYQSGRDQVTDSHWKDTFDYNQGRAEVADKQWQQEFGTKKSEASQQDAVKRAQVANYLASADEHRRRGTDAWVGTNGRQVGTDEFGNPIYDDTPKSVVAAGNKQFITDSNAYTRAIQGNDDLQRLSQITDKIGAGPTLWNAGIRALARNFGIEVAGTDQDALTQADQLKAQEELNKAVTEMKGQGQITEAERALLSRAIADPTKMTPDTLRQAIGIIQNRNNDLIEDVENWGTRGDYGNYPAYRVQQQAKRRKSRAAPASGVVDPGNSSSGTNKTSSGVSWSIVN